MRRTTLAISKTKVKGYGYYCVTVPKLGGGRTRRFFKDKREANTYLEQCRIQQQNYGTAALSMSDSLRVEATECAEKLAAFGKTLRHATEFFVAHLRSVTGSRKVQDVIEELLAARKADHCSPRYLGDLRVRLRRFREAFGEQMIAAIAARDIDDWLRSLDVGAVTRNTFRRRLAALFGFAKRRGYLAENPLPDVERAKEHAGEIEILTVGETERLLRSASTDVVPYWAIGAFAGLRRAEIERLDWEEVRLDDGFIEVKASKSKTASRRLVPIQQNLAEWLAPFRKRRGRVCPLNLQKHINDDRDRAQLRADWPQNALRHSFGSYHLARFNDAARLALEMGNSPAMIFKHYRELVKPKDAELYWAIRPARKRNIVTFVKKQAA